MKRFVPDQFTLMLIATVLAASLLPISGEPAHWFAIATNIAIGLLFFLHGARLSRSVALAGLLHWRLHLTNANAAWTSEGEGGRIVDSLGSV